MEGELESVIIDTGSFSTRAGMSGSDAPKVKMPTIIGRPKVAGAFSVDQKDIYIGHEAIAKKEFLKFEYPVVDSRVANWKAVKKIWNHIFNHELLVSPDEHNIMIIEPAHSLKSDREKVTNVMFEKFTAHGFYLANSAVLSLFSNGRTSGIVVESGYNSTDIVPVFEGYAMPHSSIKFPLGGEDLTKFMVEQLEPKGHVLNQDDAYLAARDIKHRHCYIVEEYQQELSNFTNEKEYELPDQSTISLGIERFKVPEALFSPHLIGKDDAGIHEQVFTSIMNCEQDIRNDLYSNIILSGGNTMFHGIKARMEKDIRSLAPSNVTIKIKCPPERNYSPWIGGAMLASLDNFKNLYITRQEYDELGVNALYRKCF